MYSYGTLAEVQRIGLDFRQEWMVSWLTAEGNGNGLAVGNPL